MSFRRYSWAILGDSEADRLRDEVDEKNRAAVQLERCTICLEVRNLDEGERGWITAVEKGWIQQVQEQTVELRHPQRQREMPDEEEIRLQAVWERTDDRQKLWREPRGRGKCI